MFTLYRPVFCLKWVWNNSSPVIRVLKKQLSIQFLCNIFRLRALSFPPSRLCFASWERVCLWSHGGNTAEVSWNQEDSSHLGSCVRKLHESQCMGQFDGNINIRLRIEGRYVANCLNTESLNGQIFSVRGSCHNLLWGFFTALSALLCVQTV